MTLCFQSFHCTKNSVYELKTHEDICVCHKEGSRLRCIDYLVLSRTKFELVVESTVCDLETTNRLVVYLWLELEAREIFP